MSSDSNFGSSDSIFGDGDGLLDQILDRLRDGEEVNEETLIAEYPDLADEIPQLIQLVGFVHGASQTVQPGHDLDGQLALGIKPQVGCYILERLISRGGMGAVYEARDPALNRTVAIKFLESRSAQSSQAHKRFEREARSASKLNHAHIVPIYNIGEHAGVPYYAMRFIDGASLAQVGRDRRIAKLQMDKAYVRKVATWIRDIADALAHAHEGGVIHRDIKPSNILIGKDGSAHLADFGLARDVSDATLTQSGKLIGTLRYMSPEQARGGGALDERTDVYSLGASLYELLAGHPMYAREERDAMLNQVLTEDPAHLSKVQPETPAELATITHKAIAKHRENRFQSAALLTQDLDNFLADRPIQARPPTLREHFNALDQRSKRALRWALLAIGVIVILAGISATQAFRISADRDRLVVESERATQAKEFLVGVLFKANPKSAHRAHDFDDMLDSVARGLITEFPSDHKTQAELQYRLADVFWTRSRLHEANQQLQLAAASGALSFGPNSDWVTNCFIERAVLLNFLGEHAEALTILDGVQDTAPEMAARPYCLETRARSLAMLDRIPEAKTAMASSIDFYRNKPDNGALAMAGTLEEAAAFFLDIDESESAVNVQREALAEYVRILGDSKETTSIARCRLASALGNLNTASANQEADQLLTQATSDLGALQPLPVSDLAWANGIRARAKVRLGQNIEAERLFKATCATLEKELGDHLLVAEASLSYGRFLASSHRAAEAIKYLERSFDLRSELLGPSNASTKDSKSALVSAQTAVGQSSPAALQK